MALFRRGKVWWMSFTYRGKQVRRSTETQDKKLAERILHKVLGEVAEGKWFDTPAVERKTFLEMMDKYMQEHSRLKKRSFSRDEASRKHLDPFFGGSTLEEIPPA